MPADHEPDSPVALLLIRAGAKAINVSSQTVIASTSLETPKIAKSSQVTPPSGEKATDPCVPPNTNASPFAAPQYHDRLVTSDSVAVNATPSVERATYLLES